jgi:cytochrome c oxidase subunit III
MSHQNRYYLPDPSHWPIVGSVALFSIMLGAANWLHHSVYGPYIFFFGLGLLVFMLFGWFSKVIHESLAGLYSKQMDRSYRIGMVWFIFSEVMFFAVFFGALFYVRFYIIPWLGGEGTGELTHYLLWPNFTPTWPLLQNPDPNLFVAPKSVMETWGIPAINTLILLSSGVTITWAHWGLFKKSRYQLAIGLFLTIVLGITFLFFQAHEYAQAYFEKGLTLSSGIYGTTFFMLTGFHGLHVTIGTIMLIVIFFRVLKGHFDKENHFAFEAVSWYWHFVDVVWLGLFIFVYWI